MQPILIKRKTTAELDMMDEEDEDSDLNDEEGDEMGDAVGDSAGSPASFGNLSPLSLGSGSSGSPGRKVRYFSASRLSRQLLVQGCVFGDPLPSLKTLFFILHACNACWSI